ncbi:unnamed protein product, partial [Penicillium discolor]
LGVPRDREARHGDEVRPRLLQGVRGVRGDETVVVAVQDEDRRVQFVGTGDHVQAVEQDGFVRAAELRRERQLQRPHREGGQGLAHSGDPRLEAQHGAPVHDRRLEDDARDAIAMAGGVGARSGARGLAVVAVGHDESGQPRRVHHRHGTEAFGPGRAPTVHRDDPGRGVPGEEPCGARSGRRADEHVLPAQVQLARRHVVAAAEGRTSVHPGAGFDLREELAPHRRAVGAEDGTELDVAVGARREQAVSPWELGVERAAELDRLGAGVDREDLGVLDAASQRGDDPARHRDHEDPDGGAHSEERGDNDRNGPVAVTAHPEAGTPFDAAVAELRATAFRDDIAVREIPTPQNLAPFAIALSADVRPGEDGDSVYGTGRFILLHDPDEPDAWGGAWRIVIFAQAPLETEIGTDPLLADVTWSWL